VEPCKPPETDTRLVARLAWRLRSALPAGLACAVGTVGVAPLREGTEMRIDRFAFGITAGLTCASCNGTMSGLSQSTSAISPGSDVAAGRSVGGISSAAATDLEKCHPVESVVTYGGETVPSYGRACQQPGGSWVVTASSDPARVTEAMSGGSVPRQRAAAFVPDYYAYSDPWCAVGRRGLIGPYGPGFGGVYDDFALRHHVIRAPE
jgi:hypothetical protein